MLALEHSALFTRLVKGYASYATYACHEDAKIMGRDPREICPTENDVVQTVTERFDQNGSPGLGLDPYYEMFPVSYQRPYAWWPTYGMGAVDAGLSRGAKIAIGVGVGAVAVLGGVGALLLTRQRKRT